MKFGEAIELLKQGKLVTRQGWNGRGMFIFQRPGDMLTADFIQGVKSLPQAVKDYYANFFKGYTKFSSEDAATVQFTPYLCMKAVDGTIVNGWLASQTDMLSEDWQEFTY
jgi:hypothetical protein